MTTIVNPSGGDGSQNFGSGLIIGIIVVLLIIFFFMFARSNDSVNDTQQDTPSTINVTVPDNDTTNNTPAPSNVFNTTNSTTTIYGTTTR